MSNNKLSLNQDKIDSLYQVLENKMKISKEQVRSFIVKSDDSSLIKKLSEYNLSDVQIRDLIILRSQEIETKNTYSKDDNKDEILRSFKQESLAAPRKFFVPAGDYQTDPNGLISKYNGAICSNSCTGVVTGKFLDFIRGDTILAYGFTPGVGFSYTISSLSDGVIASYNSNTVNIDALKNIEASAIRVDAIDVNDDGLADAVISVTDTNYNDFPVVLLNDKDAPFSSGYQLSACSSGNGATQVRAGYFFGTDQAGGLWCQYNGFGFFYQINIYSAENLKLITSISNWCANADMYVLDYNGDKYDDVLCLGSSQQQLFVSANGRLMVSATSDGTGNVNLFSVNDITNAQFVTGDFDGNGRDDVLRIDSTGNYLYLSDGKSFFDYMKGKANNNYAISIGNGGFCDLTSMLVSGKFNSDKRSDLWCSNSNTDKFMLSTLESDRVYPKVKALVTYKNFEINLPNLSLFNTTITTTQNYVNALNQGSINYSAKLALNIETATSVDSYSKDFNLGNQVISGKVIYTPQYEKYNDLFNGSNLEGSVVASVRDQSNEFDIMTSPTRVSAGILSPLTRISLQSDVSFSVLANNCDAAQMRVFTYKDVEASYTAQGAVTLLDENNVPLTGQRLKETAQSFINKPVSLANDGQAVFNTRGNIVFTMPYHVESSVLPCASLSSLQVATGLPKAIVRITYDNFAFTAPNLSSITTKVITSQEKLQNNKQYGQASFSKKLVLEVNLNQKIDGFTLDIKNNDIVKAGEVIYLKGFGDIQLAVGTDLSGYHVELDRKDYLKHSWSTPASQISAELFSTFNSFKITSDAEVVLVPGQCSVAKISATLYQSVPFAYTATGHFSATDENGYPITGDMLEAIAQSVISKSVSLDSLGEGVFSTSGTLSRNLVGNVITDIEDCGA